ncbi:MAG: disulfide bond formation protein B [Methylophilaceae bacterium]|nr:disulfide bond formation protein B [Methylophilaceae bacterium]
MLDKILAGRAGYLLGFLVAYAVVVLALYIQVRNDLEPCPLCIFQRIAFMVLGVAFLLAALHHPSGVWRKVHGALQCVIALVGAGIALRHVWIQNHPEEVMAECGAGFDYIFERFPLGKAVELVFKGTGECSAIDWTLLGLTIPQWSLAAFIGLAAYAVLLACRTDR